jgi:hypothetical protein
MEEIFKLCAVTVATLLEFHRATFGDFRHANFFKLFFGAGFRKGPS